MIDDKDQIRRDRSALEQALRDAGCKIKANATTCPAHDDQHASASLYADDAGVWRVKCHSNGCEICWDVFDVRAHNGGRSVDEQLRDLRPDAPKKAPAKVYADPEAIARSIGKLENVFQYTHPDTRAVELIVLRIKTSDGKTFLQCRPNTNGDGVILSAPPKPWPIYNRSRIRGAKRVIWVEGEKCVHSLAELGIVASTSPGGASNAGNADYSPLVGVEQVVIWPDFDQAGVKYGRAVQAMIEQLSPAPRIYWLDPENTCLDAKGDVADFIPRFGGDTRESRVRAVEQVLSLAEPVGAAADLDELLEATISGKRRCFAWPWRELTRISKALLPGTVTFICGNPGSSKSFFILEAAWWWWRQGLRVALLELEDDRAYHLNRVLAQAAENSDLTDTDWIRQHPNETREAREEHREAIDGFAPCLTVPDRPYSHLDVIVWAKSKAKAGAQIIVIDPITIAEAGSEKPWVADQKLITELKLIARSHEIPLVLVSHPRKGAGKTPPGMDDLAGGAAFQRFAQTILWLVRHDEPKAVTIKSDHGAFTTSINRSVKLLKTRNGRGAGSEIGFNFDGGSLRFSEQGVIGKKTRGGQKAPPIDYVADPFAGDREDESA